MRKPTVSLNTIRRRFRDRNRKFRKLTTKQQRIKIIKDVIAHLRSGKITARTNQYIRIGIARSVEASDQVHEVLEYGLAGEHSQSCQVCGIGGMFVSAVLLKNDIKVGKITGGSYSAPEINLSTGSINDDGLRTYLKKWFTLIQLYLIEAAFEKSSSTPYWRYSSVAKKSAVIFGMKYDNAEDRLIAICENMLENGGLFKP